MAQSNPIAVHSGILHDHHWMNYPGYVAEYAHLWKRADGSGTGLNAMEQTLLGHLTRFDFNRDGLAEELYIADLARYCNTSDRNLARYLANAQLAGWLVIHSGKTSGQASTYDYSRLVAFSYEVARADGWFARNTIRKGMTASSYPYDNVVRPLNKKEKKPMSAEVADAWFDQTLLDLPLRQRIMVLRNQAHPYLPDPRPKTSYKKTDGYTHMDYIVRHIGEYRKSQAQPLGRVLAWLWKEAVGRAGAPASFDDILDFWLWIDQQGLTIKDPDKISGEWWDKWKAANPVIIEAPADEALDPDLVEVLTPFGISYVPKSEVES